MIQQDDTIYTIVYVAGNCMQQVMQHVHARAASSVPPNVGPEFMERQDRQNSHLYYVNVVIKTFVL